MKKLIPIISALILPQITIASTAVEPVILTELGVKNLGIETIVVEETDFEKTTFALGRTVIIPENRSILSSRIPGRVIETKFKMGDYVEKGDNLILLESRQPGSPPPSIWLTAPSSGNITSVKTSLGSPVEPSDTLAEIDNLSTIYLIATLPQHTAGKIPTNAEARVYFPLLPEQKFTAKLLTHFACPHSLPSHAQKNSEESESAPFNSTNIVFSINNPDNLLRPYINAECSIIMEKREAVLSVPREAIQGTPSNRHVYVKHMTIPNAFDKVSVQTGMTSNDRIEILDGLFPGDEVVTRGSYSLGFAGGGSGVSLKEALDAAHGHEHNEDGSEMSPEQKMADEKSETSDHGHDHHGISQRELIFMIATAILAIALLVVSLRRGQSFDEHTELS